MKKIAVSLMALALTSTLLAGCASVGNEKLRAETEASVSKKIVEGKTTKAEVRAMFGSPAKTTFTDGGYEVWNYEFSNVSADAISFVPVVNLFGASASGKKKELVVMYERSDVVRRFSMSESDVTQKTGLFNN
ncbi:hypothetical protein K2O51_31705 (plasmid) [Cupriavidus pinatubonensis]|uniref:hypothetical protein n=1 Tax=Cupriavidus pinatubonensis TaxID=248026 RepID=UPI001C7336AF|nr:hypothetical protein [Cupriavidus pinatubonensis]QYY33592.1 hypothetical protein K2O51_31705 [Cupriavidus pinatubonensis]